MTLYGYVDKLEDDKAAVCLMDEACGHDCSACAGCSRKTQGRIIMAENGMGAAQGDRVAIYAEEKTVLTAAFLVFFLPIALPVLGYAAGKYLLHGWVFALIGLLLGLGVSLIFCRAYHRSLSRKSTTVYRVEEILRDEE